MLRSSAYDHVDDPHDPAWIGHALVDEPHPWWRRASARGVAGGALALLACLVAVVALLGAGGADDTQRSSSRATESTSLAAGTAAAAPDDVVDPGITPVDPDTSKTLLRGDRALPTASSAVRPAQVSANGALTGPTGDVGLTARVEHSDLPTLYINDGSGATDTSFDGWGATANLFGDLQGLDPLLRIRLDQLGAAMGARLEVISGLRTHEEQQALYAEYLSGTGNLAAVPGSSRHETGRAADVYVDGVALADVSGARAAAAKLGIGFPVSGESWHTELVEATG